MKEQEVIKKEVLNKIVLLDILMSEKLQKYDQIIRDGSEHDLIYLGRILDKEIGEYTKYRFKSLKSDLNGLKNDYTDGNGY